MGSPPTDLGTALAPLLRRAGSVIESEIRGRSMGSTLPPGTRIRIRCLAEAGYRTGSVVAFVAGRGLVGHRVVGRGSDRRGRTVLLTRGDGTPVCDPPVEPDLVLGEVTDWHDGRAWRPIPDPPPITALRRLAAAGLLLLVRLTLAVDPRLAGRLAAGLALVAQRLSLCDRAAVP